MKDLNQSTFFDGRLLTFINNLLYGREAVSTINNVENILLKKRDEVKKLDHDLEGRLVDILRGSKDFIAVKDGVQFLLECNKRDLLDDGVEVLEFAERDKRTLTLEQLKELMKNSGDLPMAWAVALHGDNDDSRYAEVEPPKNSVDFSRLRDFK